MDSANLPILLLLVFIGYLVLDTTTSTNSDAKRDDMSRQTLQPLEQPVQQSDSALPYVYNRQAPETKPVENSQADEPQDIAEFKKNNRVAQEMVTVKTQPDGVERQKPDLRLVFREDSWTEVVDASGERKIYRLVH